MKRGKAGVGSFGFKVPTWPTEWELDIVDTTNVIHMWVTLRNHLAKKPSQKRVTCLVPTFDLKRGAR